MATQKPESATPTPTSEPALSEANGALTARRSDALEAELAMLEAILPPRTEGSQSAPVDPATDGGGTV
jgi:hypothetical protein